MSCACGDGEGHLMWFSSLPEVTLTVAVNQPVMVDTRVLFLSPLSLTSSLSQYHCSITMTPQRKEGMELL